MILEGSGEDPDERYQSAAEFAQALVSVVRPGEDRGSGCSDDLRLCLRRTASLGEDYAPYTTSITEASVEDGGLSVSSV